MPGGPGAGMLGFISVFMLVFDIAKAVLTVFILYRGLVLINLLVKKYKDDNKPKGPTPSIIPEEPMEHEEVEEIEKIEDEIK